jgi:SAM-dependent methyltransferase
VTNDSGRLSSSSMPKPESAEESYDRFAAVYDEANAQNNYEMWLGETLLPELEKHGLRKGWALDVGCGTGRAFEPLLERGWKVFGCDLSGEMLAEAERKFGSQVGLQKLDARELASVRPPAELPGGKFDLILLLNDVVNYMTEDGDLEKAFDGVRRSLDPDHGLVAFDANTLSLFRHSFVSGNLERDARGWEWQGLTDADASGPVFEARLSGEGIETHVHRQRHWTAEQVKGALEGAGLRCLAVLGQREGEGRILLDGSPDEERDHKVIYIASLAS